MIRDSIGDWQELSELYERADELEGGALDSLLARLEAEGHRLLPQLKRMLAARKQVVGSDFLDRPPTTTLPGDGDLRWRRREGFRVGPYRLIRHLGSGGSADVWLAERADGSFARRLAIKLLHSHQTRTQRDTFAERFRRERDFLAALSHPHIAALHDAGVTEEGQPWLAVEYVEGEPITGWCDRNRLALSARIGIFLQVLGAVEYAHANLVLHRDLKPGNVFVTGNGEARLLDFGIAKLISADGSVSDTELTNEAGRPLTLQYASPEQLLGAPLSTRSDVYTLGVVLYELLVGVRPYELRFESPAQIEQAILEVEPKPPSRRDISPACAQDRSTTAKGLHKALARDLDAIVLRCLCKEPENRYSSAEALRKDIERWQRSEPIEAKRPTAWYRTRRFVSRHRLAVSLSGVAVSGILGAATVAILMSIDARREATRAVAARDFLVDVYRLTDPDSTPTGSMDKRAMLEAGAQKALTMLDGQPVLQAQVLASIGQMQINISDYRAADRNLSMAAQRYRERGDRRAWIEVQADLARNAFFMGTLDRAQQLVAAAGDAAVSFPQDEGLQFKVLEARGHIRTETGNREGARIDLTGALALARHLYTEGDARTIDVTRALANLEGESGNFDVARALFAGAAESASRLKETGAHERIGVALDRSIMETSAGQYATAYSILREVAPRCEDTLGRDSESCQTVRTISTVVALRLGDQPAAFAMLDALLHDADNDASPRRQAESLIQAGRVLALGDDVKARQGVAARLNRLASTSEQSAIHRCVALLALGEDSLNHADPEGAARWARQAIELQRAQTNPSELWLGRATTMLAVAMQAQHKSDQAAKLFDDADRMVVRALGPGHPLALLLRMNAVALWRETGQAARAATACDAAAGPLREAMGPSAPVMVRLTKLCGEPGNPPGVPHDARGAPEFFT